MTIFLVLAIYLIIIHISIPESKKMKKSIWMALGFVLVLALRSPFCGLDVVGSSWGVTPESYAGVFLKISEFSLWEVILDPTSVQGSMEVGWLLLTKIISYFTNDIQVFIAIIAILHFIPIAFVIGKYSKNIVLSYFVFVCLGFYIHFFSGIRQMMALSILLLAYVQLSRRRIGWFVVLVLLASTIHKSAVFFIVMWPLSRIHLSFTTAALSLILIVVLMPFYKFIAPVILNVFFGSDYQNYLDKNEGQALSMFVVYSVFLMLSFLRKDDSPQMGLIRMLVLVGVAGQSLGVLSTGAITRIGYYFNVFLVFLLPEIVLAFKEQSRIVVNFVAVIFLCLFFVLTTTPSNSSGVIPYSFFWQNPAY